MTFSREEREETRKNREDLGPVTQKSSIYSIETYYQHL